MGYYSSYFPQGYYQGANMPPQPPQFSSSTQQAQSNQITWVQGEAAAKAFPVGAGCSVLLMDSEDQVFYIKSTDQSGMPQPLRIYEYTERAAQQGGAGIPKNTADDYITRSEFEDFKRSLQGGEG